MIMLRALAATWHDRPAAPRHQRTGHERLPDVRDALHITSGRALDRLLAGEARESRTGSGLPTPIRCTGRSRSPPGEVGHAVGLTVRAVRQALPSDGCCLSFAGSASLPRGSARLIVHQGGSDWTGRPSRRPARAARGHRRQQGLVLSPSPQTISAGMHPGSTCLPDEARRRCSRCWPGRGPDPGLGGAGPGRLHRPLDSGLGTDSGAAAAIPPSIPWTGTRSGSRGRRSRTSPGSSARICCCWPASSASESCRTPPPAIRVGAPLPGGCGDGTAAKGCDLVERLVRTTEPGVPRDPETIPTPGHWMPSSRRRRASEVLRMLRA